MDTTKSSPGLIVVTDFPDLEKLMEAGIVPAAEVLKVKIDNVNINTTVIDNSLRSLFFIKSVLQGVFA